ncbi:uncharacterized protein PHALS_03226 [Plasmopara halstedii]|uniref:Uncharacterized protein n=1 Tax=Plasmopara halstedii TaxID=4781 RepID=A0A0P1AWL3_PLAHL|nr:uncharacterized protein PHALS_03226 [Plasmopara halstedii]CEG46628.1 hypothetical protein PHALS_03226 [Plasmopara halstedii]|eukprot:XP_024582997.1 hypothetical protein PHALS_03226 [Plasmopara halstedii]
MLNMSRKEHNAEVANDLRTETLLTQKRRARETTDPMIISHLVPRSQRCSSINSPMYNDALTDRNPNRDSYDSQISMRTSKNIQ